MPVIEIGTYNAWNLHDLVLLNRCRKKGVAYVNHGNDMRREEPPAQEAGFSQSGNPNNSDGRDDTHPRIALYCGQAVGYPYWAYYSHALLSIGLVHKPVHPQEIIANALDDFDVLIMPGGFATWGLDRAEGMVGVDATISRFIAQGGRFLGSCGGAFYMATGRPGWLGILDAMPMYTQEYLLTGAGMVSIRIEDARLGYRLPEGLEMPYYHGPVFDNSPRSARTLGTFRSFIVPSRLFIDNPLKPALFQTEMQGTPAIVHGTHGAGQVVAFSSHPEMGELVRRAIAMKGYVSQFLPIRGLEIMKQTLAFYMSDDCAGFLLIHNALDYLNAFSATSDCRDAGNDECENGGFAESIASLDNSITQGLSRLLSDISCGHPDMETLRDIEIKRLEAEWGRVMDRVDEKGTWGVISGELNAIFSQLKSDVTVALRPDMPWEERLVLVELPIRIATATLRIMACDEQLRNLA
ncbi:hypothetical protein K2X14_08850 [Acetobacter sp. TBRC 12305]|uniref:CobB/CobQ-like glutamine amidotransferase domain-containing protein n=1 Tax=Acetobacter garciniae TaxID=2817435 RepID=A0A939KMZ5_9PROT|nr:hypothetical protein [Acetobacter garciniae]MBO1325090.1 hypothetical protein [Acetobacter garciniae]MBX0344939.1 hypothetical protein [Acetobacter garciniae]